MKSSKSAPRFEIRVALLGFVSVGKTTVLNALFRDKYGEVSMRRTTAAVNYFSISSLRKKRKISDAMEESSDTSSAEEWSTVLDGPTPRTAKSTLKEITKDNVELRESQTVQEKCFEIELEEDLCEMREDTKLVVVDIPGVNEAGAGTKYMDFVAAKWTTFDCVVVVMDGKQGVNSAEQVELLELVKKNTAEKKNVPVIVLCNKVDDPEDEEQKVLVSEARKEVERVFGVGDRQLSLRDALRESKKPNRRPAFSLCPIFVHTSAVHAFIYRTASLMSLEQFKNFDKALIEKIGREEVGRQWRTMSEKERFAVTHKAVSDPRLYRERLADTNFDKFLKVLDLCIGGSAVQLALIEKQLETSKKSIGSTDIAGQLRNMFHICKVLGKPTESLKNDFWGQYRQCEDHAFQLLSTPERVHELATPMKELLSYYRLTQDIGWLTEENVILDAMRSMVRRQIAMVVNMESEKRNTNWCLPTMKSNTSLGKDWSILSQEDWKTIFRSVLLLSFNKIFCESLGQEKIIIESVLDTIQGHRQCYNCGQIQSRYPCSCRMKMNFNVKNGILEPCDRATYDTLFSIKVPDSFEHPSHWAYIAWKYCQFVQSMGKK